MLNWTWVNTTSGYICGKRKLSFVLWIMSSDLIQHRRKREKDCWGTTSSKAKQIAPDCISDYLPSFQIQSPSFCSLHLLLHLCVALPAPSIIAVLLQVPSKTKVQWKRSKLHVRVWRANIVESQGAVYISASSVDKQHQFGITHLLVLGLITFFKFVP